MFNRRPSGFTLLELLVVISIIAILAVSLTPAFARAREAGRRSVCSDNMKQIHMCLTMYEQTEGMFPTRSPQGSADQYHGGDQQQALNLLYKQYTDDVRIFSCPSKPMSPTFLQSVLPSTAPSWPGSGAQSFAVAATVGGASYSTSYGYSQGHNSSYSRVVVLADHAGASGNPKGNSDNHGKDAGQNMLSAGGSVVFSNLPENKMGMTDDGNELKDGSVFTDVSVVPSGYVDYESWCQ